MADTRELSIEEARAFLNEHVAAFDAETGPWFDELPDDAVIPLHVGELRADELRVADMLFVHGDVVLTGDHSDSWEVDHSLVLVVGNLRCRSAYVTCETLVTGDVVAGQFVYANSSNDYAFTVGGTMATKLFVEDGMASYATAFEGEAWRTMNQVVFGKPPTIAKRPREACTRAAAAATGLDSAALDDLAEHFLFPSARR
ncbi:MAG: hypothetical protein JJ863_09700 [Deltaproteobacteria bacterium]|nr:hypothetical protein [Deltaproteobacteria bacterium]